MSSPVKTKKASGLGQLIIPLVALGLLLLFNLIRDPGFYNVSLAVNNAGNPVLNGNIISIIDSASELAIIAMGMTLVTAACGGQDISVGAVGAIAGAVFVKVVFAFESITPVALILDEPTRGIDVGTKLEIQKLVLKLAEDNVSVTFISSEIEEMLRVCSRLIVMRDRKIVGELTGDELTQATVMKTIAGGEQQ